MHKHFFLFCFFLSLFVCFLWFLWKTRSDAWNREKRVRERERVWRLERPLLVIFWVCFERIGLAGAPSWSDVQVVVIICLSRLSDEPLSSGFDALWKWSCWFFLLFTLAGRLPFIIGVGGGASLLSKRSLTHREPLWLISRPTSHWMPPNVNEAVAPPTSTAAGRSEQQNAAGLPPVLSTISVWKPVGRTIGKRWSCRDSMHFLRGRHKNLQAT